MSEFWRQVYQFGHFYQEGVLSVYRSVRPQTYAIVLGIVWLIGFLLLKSGARR